MEVKINNVVLKYNSAEKFKRIKEHMEQCGKKEVNDTDVAKWLVETAMNNYKFI